MKSTKNAKPGTFLDVSGFETPFSYCGRMSNAKVPPLVGFPIGNLNFYPTLLLKNAKNGQKV